MVISNQSSLRTRPQAAGGRRQGNRICPCTLLLFNPSTLLLAHFGDRRGGLAVIILKKRTQCSPFLAQKRGLAEERTQSKPIGPGVGTPGRLRIADCGDQPSHESGDRYNPLCGILRLRSGQAWHSASQSPFSRQNMQNKANFVRFGPGNGDRATKQSQFPGQARRVGPPFFGGRA